PATFSLLGSSFATSASPVVVEKIRPYPRKAEKTVFSTIKELTLTSGPGPGPLGRQCDVRHNSPAMVFSAGGYTGNLFHDFIDGLVPLFITVNSVFPDRDFVPVVPDARNWWVSKYSQVLEAFTNHRIISFENETSTHCFTSAHVGVISHGVMTIDPAQIPNSRSFVDFHNLLDKAFTHGPIQSPAHLSSPRKPRLVLVSRYGKVGRVITNEKKVKRMIEDIGFEVIRFRPTKKTSLPEAYKLIKSSHAMLGVHGAALTHSLFLRPGSVLVQVVPVGLDWMAKVCFEKSAKAMGLEYLEYRIDVEESTLKDKYGKEDMVLKDPVAFRGSEWNFTKMNVYLKEQNLRLDRVRLRNFMIQAYNKAKEFMHVHG
ncbi:PREDICTED: protein O-linked-mannose beta-1,4-N-acetylglucosaminyltransferase 2-like, partial [Tarenaya hassleriana]|uniref:protein O-linked-mannose beta-1,4-N-acetylglucosaminyltransferase 2-like n=1 Tax=Tarenaya hassleriana TaxID=28532 RepID=UPI0008FD6A9A